MNEPSATPIINSVEAIIAETRRQIQPYVFKRLQSRTPRQAGCKIARTIAVASGKGGVGKTSFVANMAVCLAQSGQRIIILDADLGLANIDVVFGIRPRFNLANVVEGTKNIDDIMALGPNGIQIIAGASGIAELAQLEQDKSDKLINQLKFLEDKADFLLIDTSAGITDSVISFCLASDQIVIISTNEPTSMADAYGIIKTISSKNTKSNISLLVNRAETEAEGEQIYQRLSSVANRFLGFELKHLGTLPQDKNMHLAVRQQTPLMLFSPMSPAAKSIRQIVSRSFYEMPPEQQAEEEEANKEQSGFFYRLSQYLKGRPAKQ